jgi:CO dehydrogenase/acetyl-CoA synthase gamma subunit (corrinoid Fe-S protein)
MTKVNNMTDDANETMAANSQAFLDLSKKIMEEVMASCQLENFNSVSLNIPMEITGEARPQNYTSQDEIWKNINQLYASQETMIKLNEQSVFPDASIPDNSTSHNNSDS